MKRIIPLLILFITFNLVAQTNIKDMNDALVKFDEIFDDSALYTNGLVTIDMGSASAGRYQFKITDVNISMEERDEEPGCADICPPRILIYFKCARGQCITDPAFASNMSDSGVIEIYDLAHGRKAYDYLVALKKFMKNR